MMKLKPFIASSIAKESDFYYSVGATHIDFNQPNQWIVQLALTLSEATKTEHSRAYSLNYDTK